MKHALLSALGVLVVLGAGFAWGGCGPVESTSLIVQADTALHNAKTADADQKAPYEFTAAEQYLHKAREEWGRSDFEYSVDFATKARDLAIQAKEIALKKTGEDEE